MVNATPRLLYPRELDPVTIVQEAGWAPGLVWTGAENLALTRIRSPYRPARSGSLYQLSYPGPVIHHHRPENATFLSTIQATNLLKYKGKDVLEQAMRAEG